MRQLLLGQITSQSMTCRCDVCDRVGGRGRGALLEYAGSVAWRRCQCTGPLGGIGREPSVQACSELIGRLSLAVLSVL